VRPPDALDPNTLGAPTGLPADLQTELSRRKGAAWTAGFQYQPENHYEAEPRDACDFTTIDYAALPTPGGLLAVAVPLGGTQTAATHAYVVYAIDQNGHTAKSSEVTVSNALNDANVLTWDKVADYAQYAIAGRVHGSLGLLAVVGPFDEDETATWTDTGSISPGAAPPSTNTTGGPGIYTNLAIVKVVPYLLRSEDKCTSFGFPEHDFIGRAKRLSDNAQYAGVEAEFWGGALARSLSYPNDYLTNPTTVTDVTPGSGPPSVARGLAILQDALANCGFGGQGMIHLQPQTSPTLLTSRRNGQFLYDIFDNVVVPGVGYTGLGPDNAAPTAGCAWMYATDLVMVRVEDEATVTPDSMAEALDRGQAGEPNTFTYYADRFACAYFDGSCHFGIQVTLPT
jgi:hypothetical protein